MNADCNFCRIVRPEAPASFVFENDIVAAFLDTTPITAGHTLVIPKRHAAYLAELLESQSGPIFEAGKRIAAAMRGSLVHCEGVNFHLADGAAAGQAVFHLHLHVIPRSRDDGAGLRRPASYGEHPPRRELDAIAQAIRDRL